MNGFDADQLDLMWERAHEVGRKDAEKFFPDDGDFAEVKNRLAKQIALEEFQAMASPYPPRREPKRFT